MSKQAWLDEILDRYETACHEARVGALSELQMLNKMQQLRSSAAFSINAKFETSLGKDEFKEGQEVEIILDGTDAEVLKSLEAIETNGKIIARRDARKAWYTQEAEEPTA